jgi:hypothetical protein
MLKFAILSPTTAGLIIFASVLGSALLAMFVRGLLPEHHLSTESKDMVKPVSR